MRLIDHVGVTGTKHGGTAAQLYSLRDFFVRYGCKFLHEGDCIGVDAQAAVIAKRLGAFIISHPPDDPKYRAYAPADEIRPEKSYGVRDRDIVDECELLVGVPRYAYETTRSGTWMTIRYAKRVHHTTYLIWPDGTVQHYWGPPCD